MAQTIVVHRFWTQYENDPSDPAKKLAVDWVAYGPLGGNDRSVTLDKVSRLGKLQALEGSTNPAVVMAHERWSIIQRFYDAWKAGQEAPLDGTPLAAWNALTPEQAALFRTGGVKTVEAIAEMTDAHIVRFPIPNMRDLVRQAKLFIESADQTRFAASLAAKEQEIDAIRADNVDRDLRERDMAAKMREMEEMIAKLAAGNPAAAAVVLAGDDLIQAA